MRDTIQIDLTGKNSTERIKEIMDKLETGLKNLFDSDQYQNYLDTMAKFHNYSFNNTLLIAMQKPDASLVAGFHKWKNELGRKVKKGEKAIKILAPAPYKKKVMMTKIDPNTHQPVFDKDGAPVKEEKEITVQAFKIASVFDVNQTEGREIPTIGVHELTGNVEQYPQFFEAVKKTSPVPVEFENIHSGARGYYHQVEKRIAIQFGMSEMQNLKTLIHEIAHARLHAIDKDNPPENPPDRYTKEVQAESVAYTVCQHYGLDTSDYSFGYIAGWSEGKELPELKASLEIIRTASHELITDIDRELAELQKDRPMEEAAFRLEGEGYLHIQETDNGYDYTLYDQKLHHRDGGLLDEPGLSISEARKAILEYHSLEPSKIDSIPLQAFAQMRDAVEQAETPSIQAKLQTAREKATALTAAPVLKHASDRDCL